MKIPLRFQITEFDCGTVALQNAFNFLYEREEIPPSLIKAIHKYTLDCYDDNGQLGGRGTSRAGIKRLTQWITDYTDDNNFKVKCDRFDGKKINLNMFRTCLINNGVILIRCWLRKEHYVIITKIENNKAYVFDPYYEDENKYNNDPHIEMVFDQPFTHNRIVSLERIFSETKEDLAMGPIDDRECLIINRITELERVW